MPAHYQCQSHLSNTALTTGTITIVKSALQPTFSPLASFTSSFHRQESKVASHNRSSEEVRSWEPAISLSLVQVCKRPVRSGLVKPLRHALEDLSASLG